MSDSIDCVYCGEPIEDGQDIVDGNHGEAVVREGEETWTGTVEYTSQITTVHEECFEQHSLENTGTKNQYPRQFDEELTYCPDCGKGLRVNDSDYNGGSIDRVIVCNNDECSFSAIETFTHETTLEQEA